MPLFMGVPVVSLIPVDQPMGRPGPAPRTFAMSLGEDRVSGPRLIAVGAWMRAMSLDADRSRRTHPRYGPAMGSDMTIDGTVADGFGPVADAFERNFSEHGELGAAVLALRRGRGEGRPVGWRRRRGVRELVEADDTLQLVYSTTKGAAAICVAHMVEAGRMSYADTAERTGPSSPRTAKGVSRSRS